MTYLDQRKQLLKEAKAYGFATYRLEEEIEGVDRIMKPLNCDWCGENECICPECGNEQKKCKDSSEGHCEDCDPQNSMGFIYG